MYILPKIRLSSFLLLAGLMNLSYLPALLGNTRNPQSHDYLYWEFNERRGPIQAITEGDWKLLYFQMKNEYELYNLEEDISEQNNLVDIYLELVADLKATMHSTRSEHPEFPLAPYPSLSE